MNLQQLEYIIALDQFKHFGQAAEHCRVSQPTLSTMIQKLEEELGAKIFDRSSHPIRTTAVGRRILGQASQVLRQVELFGQIVEDETNALGGKLTLSILPTIAPYLLPRVLPLLERELPNLSITFTEEVTSQCLESLRSGRADAAIIATDPEDELLTSTHLYYEEFVGYVGREEALFHERLIRTSEIDGARLWLLDEGHCFRDQLMRYCQIRRASKHNYSYRQGSLATFKNMVELGTGLTFLPELIIPTLSQENKELVRPFAIPRPTRHVELCVRRDFARTQVLEVLSRIIRSTLPERMQTLSPDQVLA